MLEIFISTYILSILTDVLKTIIETVINFKGKENRSNDRILTPLDSCFIIPCMNSQDVIQRTLFTLPHEYKVICVVNASTDKTLDILRGLAMGSPNLTVINTEKPGKMGAALLGILEAKRMGFTDFILIDDDIIFPKKEIAVSSDSVATGFPIIPLYPYTWIEVAQTIEYMGMVISKRAQGILGNIIMCSGAAGAYNIETFLNVLKLHNGIHVGDDLQCSYIHHNLGYKLGFNSSLGVVTEVPNTLKSFWKQRAKRWEQSPIINYYWIFKTIFGSVTRGYWIRWIAFYRVFVTANDVMRLVSLPYVIIHFPGTLVGVWAITYILFALKAAAYYCFYKDYRYSLTNKMLFGILSYPIYSSLLWVTRLYAIPYGLIRAFKSKTGGIYV
jgi:cellulose synthase/poly-beta-1,6-N-acetylglucosamine synthase-like glycosyltransferase